MSAIAGIVHFDGSPVAPGIVEKMTAAMANRGPDGIHHWTRRSVALGQCMLRTMPESLDERQPLANEDESVVVVLDGCVDNTDELRRELAARGAVLRTRTDAELVLRSYEAWGDDCARHVIGEFVFFVWDARRRRLHAARDAAGTRHFHYHAGDGWFAFASEIRGLLALQRIEPRLNESRLLDYLIVEFDRDNEVETFYEGIQRMPAGHAMTVGERGPTSWRYWDPALLPLLRFGSMRDCEEAFLDQFRIAVKCRLRSTGPVASALSGGLDSSSIVGLIRKEFRDDLGQPLRTYSLIREDRENCPDWRGVSAMLREGWIEPTVITSAAAGEVGDAFVAGIRDMDEPFAFSMDFPDTLMWDAARRAGCRVIMDGTAGDLLFFHLWRSLHTATRERMPAHVFAVLAAYRRHEHPGGFRSAAWIALREAAPERMRAAYRRMRKAPRAAVEQKDVAGDLRNIILPSRATRYIERRMDERMRESARRNGDSLQEAHARNFTSGYLSFAHEVRGQAALSRGLEPRSPFSDRRMLEFAVCMPPAAKLAAHWYKALLRECMAGILPDEVRWRRVLGQHPGPKFFEALFGHLAKNRTDVWNLERLSDGLGQWISIPALRRTWDEYHRCHSYWAGYNLLLLVVLCEWLAARHSLRA